MKAKTTPSARVAALVGPSASGKTSLLEALLLAAGALSKKGSARERSTFGDVATDAKTHGIGAEMSAATVDLDGERWTFLDAPGAGEFASEVTPALLVADVAVVVVDADPDRAVAVSPLFAALDARRIPHVVFVNKVDVAGSAPRLRETLAALQGYSARPLVLRELPLREGDAVTGFVDLVSERAYGYKSHEDAALARLPEGALPEEKEARTALLERLADLDDHLLSELLEDVAPPQEELAANLREDLRRDLLVDVFFGSAEQDHGVKRLLSALREECPEVAETAARLGLSGEGTLVQSFKTVHAPHVGKQSWVRVWRGEVTDGQELAGARVSGVTRLHGARGPRVQKAATGEVVALGHLHDLATGQGGSAAGVEALLWCEAPQPSVSAALHAVRAGDDVKLSGALAKLSEEDPGLRVEHHPEAHELVLWAQGEKHLRLALVRLRDRYALDVQTQAPRVPYRETVRATVTQHGRFKHQSGGHGAFGDVILEVGPLGRGEGFAFAETVTGGAVPRQYFSSVEKGTREYCKQGPLGFPVVDLKVTLTGGSYHAVDSSDAAFQQAARVTLTEALPKCDPVLLEPMLAVELWAPSEHTAKLQRLVTARRGGHLQGYDQHAAWRGWDVVRGELPEAEVRELATELRTATQGLGGCRYALSRYREVDAREAERVVAARKKELQAAHGR